MPGRLFSRLHAIWPLTDQAAVSLGTFLTNLLLARALLPAEYGAYALIFSVALFVNNVYWAVVSYPLSIGGAVADEQGLRQLTLEALAVGLLLTVPIGCIIFGTAVAVGRADTGPAAVVAIALWQFQDTLRRALFAHMRHRHAVAGDALSYLGQVVLVWLLDRTGNLSVTATFVAMALTSAAAALIQATQLGLTLSARIRFRCALVTAWTMGRWLILSQSVSGIGFQIFPWLLAVTFGAAETAAFQAVANAVNVTNPLAVSIGNQVMPAAARAHKERGVGEATRVGFRYVAQGGAILMPYFALLLVWPEWVLAFLYGPSSPYAGLAPALRIASIATALSYLSGVLAVMLMSLQENRKVSLSQLISAAGFVLSVPLITLLAVTGAYLGVLSVYLIRTVLLIAQIAQVRRRSARPLIS